MRIVATIALYALLAAALAGGLVIGICANEGAAALAGVFFTILFVAIASAGHFLGEDVADDPDKLNAESQALIDAQDKDRFKLLLEEWKHITDVQMHFNEMIIRMRTLAVSVVITVFGAAGFVVARYPEEFIEVGGNDIHLGAVVLSFGLALWATIFLIDYLYYYKLLLGAVYRGYAIDKAFEGTNIVPGLRAFGSARKISRAIGPSGFSEVILWLFYAIVYIAGLTALVTMLIVIDPILTAGMRQTGAP